MKKKFVYKVSRISESVKIDGNWDKPVWKGVNAITIENYLGELPHFFPFTQVKMMYDKKNLYIIFLVRDKFVKCITNEINGPVWEDSCVEFFFSPCTEKPERYFNLEVNCGGTPLMYYNVIPRKEFVIMEAADIKQIEIAHSLPQIVCPEIPDAVVWTVEYRLPLEMLEKYSSVTYPEKGTKWQGNFFKIAEITSNPHYLTWSFVDHPTPNFHLPEFFGEIIFK